MDRRLSIYLNALRILAALAVLVAHLFHPHLTAPPFDPVNEYDYGSDAVILFFVLSGFVIAHTAIVKDRTAGGYLFSRITRIASVALPAVALTLALDVWGGARDPSLYADWRHSEATGVAKLTLGVTLTNEWSWGGLHIGTNHPLWSLSYELAYYLIFLALWYVRGWRRPALILALALAAGVNILLLLPAWGLGVAARRLIERPRGPLVGVMIFVATACGYYVMNRAGMDNVLLYLTADLISGHPLTVFRYSGEFLWAWLVAGLAALHLIAAKPALALAPDWLFDLVARPVRWVAGATFSIYAAHYPILMLTATFLPDGLSTEARVGLHGGLTLILCLIFAALFERPLPRLRAALRRRLRLVTP